MSSKSSTSADRQFRHAVEVHEGIKSDAIFVSRRQRYSSARLTITATQLYQPVCPSTSDYVVLMS